MALLPAFGLSACAQPTILSSSPSPPAAATGSLGGAAAPRLNGDVGAPRALPPAEFSLGTGQVLSGTAGGANIVGGVQTGGDVSLEFADTDIRTVVAQILGSVLKVNYTIDPGVKGTATFHSAHPLSHAEVLNVLQALLAQTGAALVRSGDLYRVLPALTAARATGLSEGGGTAGSVVVPLRYASAEELAKVIQPVVGTGAKVAADPASNAVLVSGDPVSRDAVVELVRGFDVNELAGQSYALLPIPQAADPKDFANTLQDAFRAQGVGGAPASGGQTGGAPAAANPGGLICVLPLQQAGAVLVVASQPRYIAAARRVYGLIERHQNATLRSWHVYYLQNSHSDDIAYLLQRAFTPNDVTAQPTTTTQPGAQATSAGGFGGGGFGGGGFGGGGIGGGGFGGGGMGGGGFGGGGLGGGGLGAGGGAGAGGFSLLSQRTAPAGGAAAPAAGGASSNPLLGGLSSGGQPQPEAMRIISNPQNNAVLIYATRPEENTVEAMLRKVDILPLQVRIDATIAEVTLNDALQYGTQFFFKEGDVNQLLSTAGTGSVLASTGTQAIAGNFPGFVFNATSKAVQAAISALQAVTTVRVLSAPEVMVLDNQPASLQVGDLVPYLTTASQSTLVAGSPIINSINYRQTGVIMQVTPRVNSGGLVTLDIAQEVSGIDTAAPQFTFGTNITSPTFSERLVQSRVVVQDGQTVGLAGLITDNIQRGNSGIPFLKNVPVLGFLAGTQNNSRQRTELLVLITPHVVADQRAARVLTDDLRHALVNAAAVPALSQTLPVSGSPDPNAGVLRRLGVQP